MSDIRYQACEGLTDCMFRATKLSVDTFYDFYLYVCPNVISIDLSFSVHWVPIQISIYSFSQKKSYLYFYISLYLIKYSFTVLTQLATLNLLSLAFQHLYVSVHRILIQTCIRSFRESHSCLSNLHITASHKILVDSFETRHWVAEQGRRNKHEKRIRLPFELS